MDILLKDCEFNATLNFAYFTANFPYNFIQDCWKDNKILMDHLTEKLNSYSKDDCISVGSFMHFFFELDRGNQFQLIRWIKNNYNSGI